MKIRQGLACICADCMMRIVLKFSTVIILISVTPSTYAQGMTTTCKKWFQPKTLQDAITAEANPANNRQPVIFGKPYEVPPMRIRYVDGVSGETLETKYKEIAVWYYWEWLEYPYPEHAWGAWSHARDTLTCVPDSSGWIETPPHIVQPRGWYDGKYTRFPWPQRPSFTGVTIRTVTSGGFPDVYLEKKDFRRFKDSDLVVRVFDGWRAELTWQAKKWRPRAAGRFQNS